jgi:single-strand DNA-binding protein
MNKAILTGRLKTDPKLSFTSGKGTAVATFTIAVDSGYGENKETAFIPVVVWNKGAEAVANYTHKGSKVLVQGRINTRSYDKDGIKHYVTEIIADNFGGVEFLDSKNGGNNQNDNNEGMPEGLTEDTNYDILF